MFERMVIVIGLAVVAGSAAHAQDYSALLEEAIETIEWQIESDWAFTETSLHDEKLWVGRHDPRLEGDDRWTLLSVDGQTPTSKEAREYRHDKDEHEDDSDDGTNRLTTSVEADTLQLIDETETHWVFSFVPDMDQEELVDSVDATIRIIKDGRYVEFMEIRNTENLEPGWGTKITEFLTRLTFGPAIEGGPIVPYSINIKVTGRALLFINFDEIEVIQYSDFEYHPRPTE